MTDRIPQRRTAANPPETWLSPQDVADRLSVSRATVRRWIEAGELRAVKLTPQTWRVATSELARFVEGRANA
jgi:excisionase family DNA binding protein